MKTIQSFALVAMLLLLGSGMARAEEKGKAKEKGKETTLKGRLVCGKCTLKITSGCSNVLEVVKGKKKVHYILDDKAKGEKYHKAICPPGSSTKEVTVTGEVYKKGDQWHVKNPTVKIGKGA